MALSDALRTLASQVVAATDPATVTFRTYADVYDPVTRTVTRTATDTTGVKAQVVDYALRERPEGYEVGDQAVLVPAPSLPSEPEPGNAFVISGVEWNVVDTVTTRLGGQAITYTVQVRK